MGRGERGKERGEGREKRSSPEIHVRRLKMGREEREKTGGEARGEGREVRGERREGSQRFML